MLGNFALRCCAGALMLCALRITVLVFITNRIVFLLSLGCSPPESRRDGTNIPFLRRFARKRSRLGPYVPFAIENVLARLFST